jgi:hypothetical protein
MRCGRVANSEQPTDDAQCPLTTLEVVDSLVVLHAAARRQAAWSTRAGPLSWLFSVPLPSCGWSPRGEARARRLRSGMDDSRTAHRSLDRYLAVLLVGGALLLGVAAAFHPTLPPGAAGQMQVMAATPQWRMIHLAMLVGSGLTIVGIWLRVDIDGSGRVWLLRGALATIAAGIALNATNVAFMAGRGAALAMHSAGQDSAAVRLFAASHSSSLEAAGIGNLAVAFGCAVLGWIEWHDPTRPRWTAALAWLAAFGGVLGVALFDPASRGAVAGVALFVVWSFATGVLVLLGPRIRHLHR